MRPIKFRAWDNELKEMFFPSSVCWKENVMWICGAHGKNKLEYEIAKPRAELMQFTGLHDKNGKEIYEGDVVEYIRDNERLYAEVFPMDSYGVQIWNNKIADEFSSKKDDMIRLLEKNSKGPLQDEDDEDLDCDQVLVVGNIHENKEFIKKHV